MRRYRECRPRPKTDTKGDDTDTYGPNRLLVVEDDPVLAGMISFVLGREGFAVDFAPDGRAALSRLDGPPPSLVVLDIMLPHASGHEILERVRMTPGWAHVPVVMLTAKNDVTDVTRAFGAGADDYVEKPFTPEELVARIRRLLRARV